MRQMPGDLFGYIDDQANAQAFEDLKQLAPMYRIGAAFDLAEEVLTDAHAASSIILPDALGLATGAHYLADGGCVGNRYLHGQSSRS